MRAQDGKTASWPNGGDDNFLELLDAVACHAVCDRLAFRTAASQHARGRTAARHYTSVAENDAKPQPRGRPHTWVTMGMLESMHSQMRETSQATGGARLLLALVHELEGDQLNAPVAWIPHLQIKEMGRKGKGNDMETQEEAVQCSCTQSQASMKPTMAFHPLHECPLSTIARSQRHGLAHPVGTGEVRAAVRRRAGAAQTSGELSAKTS